MCNSNPFECLNFHVPSEDFPRFHARSNERFCCVGGEAFSRKIFVDIFSIETFTGSSTCCIVCDKSFQWLFQSFRFVDNINWFGRWLIFLIETMETRKFIDKKSLKMTNWINFHFAIYKHKASLFFFIVTNH